MHVVARLQQNVPLLFCSVFIIPLGTCRQGKALCKGVTIFISQLNDLNAENNPSPAVT